MQARILVAEKQVTTHQREKDADFVKSFDLPAQRHEAHRSVILFLLLPYALFLSRCVCSGTTRVVSKEAAAVLHSV